MKRQHWITTIYRLFEAFVRLENRTAPALYYADLALTTEVVKTAFCFATLIVCDILIVRGRNLAGWHSIWHLYSRLHRSTACGLSGVTTTSSSYFPVALSWGCAVSFCSVHVRAVLISSQS